MAKKIEAIIREEKLEDVKEALHAIGIVGMNVFEVRGHGRQGGVTLTGRSGTYQIDMLPRVQVDIVLSDHNVEKTVEIIRESARTGGDAGDGLIFILPVDDVIRVRTGERGQDALSYEGDIDSRLARYYAPRISTGSEAVADSGSGEGDPRVKGLFNRLLGR